ncbi:hypothetical protein BDE02_05G059900 [Populus trichocarpa]|nr:hypothetical protein BDE02_05G059900 [Populus trichocarpa]
MECVAQGIIETQATNIVDGIFNLPFPSILWFSSSVQIKRNGVVASKSSFCQLGDEVKVKKPYTKMACHWLCSRPMVGWSRWLL